MKILMHCIYFPPEVGGLESHVYYLCKALVERGHEVDMVTSRSLPGVPEREVMDGIRVWRTWFPARKPWGWIAHAFGSTSKLSELALRADVIHAQAFASVLPGVVARRATGKPLVATFHTSHFLTRAEHPFWRPILGRLVRWCDYRLAASEEIARVGESLAPGVSIEALTNGVDTRVFRRTEPTLPPVEATRIMVPRRLFPKNGVEYFVRALPIIAQERRVEAVIIGDGPEREKLEALAVRLGVADRIRFLGARPHAEMPGLLSSGDIAVLPSLMEATSVAALESMACELPVAASRVGGLPEIIDESVGTLFKAADPEDLAGRVLALLARADLPTLGAKARERVARHWSNAQLAERHLEIYEQVISSGAQALLGRKRSN